MIGQCNKILMQMHKYNKVSFHKGLKEKLQESTMWTSSWCNQAKTCFIQNVNWRERIKDQTGIEVFLFQFLWPLLNPNAETPFFFLPLNAWWLLCIYSLTKSHTITFYTQVTWLALCVVFIQTCVSLFTHVMNMINCTCQLHHP